MSLFDSFLEYNKHHTLLQDAPRLLLAVSGGMDSMVMTHLFARAGVSMALAHCNFMLRGEDADLDQKLVLQTAQQLGTPFFTVSFDTLAYSQLHAISIQMAARDLRYEWLEKLRTLEGFDLIATAHHLDDSIETLLINLSRGTGIRGLKGIPIKNGPIIRPLLFAGRQQIEAYAKENNISYRSDLSNLEDKYLRNRIRHHVIPVMMTVNPNLHDTMLDFFDKMKATGDVLEQAVESARQECMHKRGNQWSISIKKLQKLASPGLYLYEFLQPMGFSGKICQQIIGHLDGQPGKLFYSPSHGLLKDRDFLMVFPKDEPPGSAICYIYNNTSQATCGEHQFSIRQYVPQEPMVWPADEKTALLDFDKLVFPLILRAWHPGDRVLPLGMQGSKKVSDLLIDCKTPLTEKTAVKVLISEESIAWVAGYRIDNRFKITKNTKIVFSIQLH